LNETKIVLLTEWELLEKIIIGKTGISPSPSKIRRLKVHRFEAATGNWLPMLMETLPHNSYLVRVFRSLIDNDILVDIWNEKFSDLDNGSGVFKIQYIDRFGNEVE
jgi:hypothetical protein